MSIRLDPRLPLVWRDPSTLQIGVDHPVVVLDGLTVRDERFLSLVSAGHGRDGVAALATRAGWPQGDAQALVDRLEPALVPSPPPRAVAVTLAGDNRMAEETHLLLSDSGVGVVRVDAVSVVTAPPCHLGLSFTHQVHDPEVTSAWLRRDVSHLTVVSGDRSTRVGPFVVPGVTACSRCLDLYRSEVETCWGVIAGQLWGRRGPEPGLVEAREIAVRAARRVLSHLTADRDPDGVDDAVIETIDGATGAVNRSTSRLHPACGCAALPRNDSADAPSWLGSAPGGPTTDSAVASLA